MVVVVVVSTGMDNYCVVIKNRRKDYELLNKKVSKNVEIIYELHQDQELVPC